MNPHRVVITGSAGRLGGIAFSALGDAGHGVLGTDCNPPPEKQERFIQSDLRTVEISELKSAFQDATCIVHLAALPDDSPDYDFEKDLLHVNVVGTYKILEAACQARVPRVLLASSLQVVDGYMRDGVDHISVTLPPRPRYLYAVTKVSLEAVGQVYATKHGLDVLAARFGWCPRSRSHVARLQDDPIAQDVYLSPRDAAQFFQTAVNAKDWGPGPSTALGAGRFNVVNATSNPKNLRDRVDLTGARQFGFDPRDQWPTGATDGLPLVDNC